MIRALFIAIEFPPLNNTGVHRSAKFVKYLRGSGVEPIVVTIDGADAAESFSATVEPALLNDLPHDVPIYALPCPVPSRDRTSRLRTFLSMWLRLEDSFATRMRPALARTLPAIIERHRPDVVYVSMPPFSAGRLAADIAKAHNLPLVVDMRDGWSHWCMGAFPTIAHWALVMRRERQLFAAAQTVVTVTPQLADIFRRTHPDLPRTRFQVVSNGYDGELNLPDVLDVHQRSNEATVTIGYVGRFYYSPQARTAALTPWWKRRGHRKLHYQPVREDWLYRSPHFFFRSLAELRRRDPMVGSRVRFALVGAAPPWWDAMVAEHGVGDVVTCYGQVPNSRVAELTATFDAQLCTSVKVHGGEDYALASKTFDYVRSGRPILGLVTRGSQREFLEQSGLAIVADPDDLEACVSALARLTKGGLCLRPNHAFVGRYSRQALAERMGNVLRDAVEDHFRVSHAGDKPVRQTRRNLRRNASKSDAAM